jgi:hypothetical protein
MVALFDPLSQALLAQAASPEARQSQQLDELFRTINADASPATAQNSKPLSLPFPGMAVRDAPPPQAATGPKTQAQGVDSRFLDGGTMPTSSKRQDRLGPEGNVQMGRTSSAAPRADMIKPPEPPIATPDFGPSFGERLTNFGNALTSQGTVTNFAEQDRQRNATYKALRGMGLDDQMARAAVLDQRFLQTILQSRVGKPDYTTIDNDLETIIYDPRANQIVNRFPKQIEEATRLRRRGQERGKIEAGKPEEFRVDKKKLTNLNTSFSTVEGDLVKAIEMARNQGTIPETGPIGGLRSTFAPWTDAGTMNQLLDTIRANIGFDKLQAMRDASPTGGALGQVSEFENRLLQATSGSLSQWGDDKFLVRNLERILENWRGLNQAYRDEFKEKFSIPQEAEQAADGNYYIADPDDPSGYPLQWEPDFPGAQ